MILEDSLPQPYKGFYFRKSDGFFIPTSIKIEKAIELIRREHLTKLEINPLYFEGDSIDFLKELNFLVELNLLKDGVDISVINSMKNLKKLTIQESKNKYAGSIDFKNLWKLEGVQFDWSVKGSETIFECHDVRYITIYCYDRYELLEFAAFDDLRSLSFEQSSIVSLNGIDRLPHLRNLELINCFNLESLAGIRNLRRLVKLRIEYCRKVDSLAPISDVQSLEYLNFSNQGKVPDVSFLSNLRNLKELIFIEDTDIIDGRLEVVEGLVRAGSLSKVLFRNRRHYSHSKEDLGYKPSPYLKRVFGK